MTVAPELDALVRACFANPKANLPRLVLADYLDEQGESDRATILRIQCELPPPKKGKRPQIKRGTGKELREAVARLKERFAPLREFLYPFKFIRGFLAAATGYWPSLAKHKQLPALQRLFAEGWVESVRTYRLGANTDSATFALLRQAGTFEVTSGQLETAIVARLAAECRPNLQNCRLRKLILRGDAQKQFNLLIGSAKPTTTGASQQDYRHLTPATATLIAESGVLNGVWTMWLGGDPGEDGFRRIAEHPAMREVERLDIVRLEIPPAAFRPLWRTENRNLTHLALIGVPLGDDGVRELCRGTFLPSTALNLHDVGVTSAGVRQLVRCRRLAGLSSLSLHGNALDAAPVIELMRSPTFARLTHLSLTNTGIVGPELLPALFAAPHRPEFNIAAPGSRYTLARPAEGLPRLTVGVSNYQDRSLVCPAGTTCPEPLAAMTVSGLGLTVEALRTLRDWVPAEPVSELAFASTAVPAALLPDLLHVVAAARPDVLHLTSLELGIRACQTLAASPALANVEKLVLNYNPIRLTGALALAASPHRGNLKELSLFGCGLGRADQNRVLAAFDGVNVQF